MMNNLKVVYAAVIGAAMGLAALPASALPVNTVDLGGVVVPVGGDTYLNTGALYEGALPGYTSPITAVGQVLGGIGSIDAIRTGGGATVWAAGGVNDSANVQLTFQFGDYVAQKIFTDSSGIHLWFSGGVINAYTAPYGTFNPSGTPVSAAISSALGNPWLNLVGGAVYTCAAADGCFSGTGTQITLESTINLPGTLINIFSGSGNGFLDVAAGTGIANSNFDTNSVFGHDIGLTSSFSTISTGSFGTSGAFSMRGLAVPEPGSLFLLGIGALSFGVVASRKRNA